MIDITNTVPLRALQQTVLLNRRAYTVCEHRVGQSDDNKRPADGNGDGRRWIRYDYRWSANQSARYGLLRRRTLGRAAVLA